MPNKETQISRELRVIPGQDHFFPFLSMTQNYMSILATENNWNRCKLQKKKEPSKICLKREWESQRSLSFPIHRVWIDFFFVSRRAFAIRANCKIEQLIVVASVHLLNSSFIAFVSIQSFALSPMDNAFKNIHNRLRKNRMLSFALKLHFVATPHRAE